MLSRPLELLQAGPVDDPVEPGRERGVAAEARQRAEGAHVTLLQRVVHALAVAEQTKRQRAQAAVVRPHEGRERAVVALARELEHVRRDDGGAAS